MRSSDKLPRGIRRLFRLPSTYDRRMQELDEEIRFHIDAEIEKLRRSGMSEIEARSAAEARFGDSADLRAYCGVIAAKRWSRQRLSEWYEELMQDFQWAVRQIARAPAFSATVVAILALGVGVNTAVFSVMHHMLIAPLPYPDGNRMVELNVTDRAGRIAVGPTIPMLESWRARSRTVGPIVALQRMRIVVGDSSRGPTESIIGAGVSPALRAFLNERPLYGRMIAAEDTMPDAPPVAVIGESLRRRAFGASPSIIGERIVLNGVSHTVIGVVSKRFVIPFMDVNSVLVPLRRAGENGTDAIGKLRSGVSIDDANREAARMFPARSELNPNDAPAYVEREIDLVSDSVKQLLFTFFGAVSVILLIASANVANLLLARSWSRQREFAVRVALGAGRGRILRQVLAESSILALAASGLSLAVAAVALKAIITLMPGSMAEVRLEAAVLVWSLIVAQVMGLSFGLIPAFTASNTNVGDALKAGARTAVGNGFSRRMRTALVVGEMALSVVLLVGAGLLVRTLNALNRVDVGFQSDGLASVDVRFAATSFPDAMSREAALRAVVDGIRGIPGVRGVTNGTKGPPGFAIGLFQFSVDGQSSMLDSVKTFDANGVSSNYFAVAGIPLLKGRTFSPGALLDTAARNDEIIINESFARRIWPNGDALGARLRHEDGRPPTDRPRRSKWSKVVGIVGDIRLPSGGGVGRAGRDFQVYLPRLRGPSSTTLVLRSNLAPAALAKAVDKVIRNVSSGIRVSSPLRTANEMLSARANGQRVVLKLIGVFAVLAMLLAAVGLHAVIAYSVGQRVREIGLRIALGATAADVAQLVLRQALGLALAGAVIGSIIAIASMRLLRSLLYGVTTSDPLTLAAVAVGLLIVAAVATFGPARRAARLDPMAALRAD